MAVKEFLTKYKLYTILAVVLAALIAGGITLGVLLSRDTTPPADAADVENAVYITADGTQVTDGSANYDYILTMTYDDTVADLICELHSVERRDGSEETTIDIPETVNINGTARTITTMYGRGSISSSNAVFYPVRSFITEAFLPDTITNIGYYAFRDCTSLTSVYIPYGVTTIRWNAFQNCTSLTSVSIPDSVRTLDTGAFLGCASLTTIYIPNSVTSIGNQAFLGCTSLTSINIPDSENSLAAMIFSGCTSLTSITIPDSVTRINNNAFSGCSSLTALTIPASVTSIGSSVFSSCTSLPAIEVDEDSQYFMNDEYGVLYTKDGTRLIACPAGTTLTAYDILDTTTTIDSSAFEDCSSLTTITIPDSVTRIGSSAFSGCSSLTSITIPDGVTSIGSSAFYDCSSLSSITIPDGVTSIGNYAFYYCTSLSSINIPSSVTSIGGAAFSYCSDLTNVYFYNDITSDTSMIGSEAFYSNNSNVTYWFKDQTSLDNAIAIDTASTIKFTGYSDHSNFQLMVWNVSVVCDETKGSVNYTEPESITYGTEITATVTPNGSAEFLYWEVKVTQSGNEIASTQIANPTLNYTITDFGTYTFTAVFDFDILITSESGGTEFDITRETNDGIVYTYSIKMKDGYSLNRIALISTDDTISSTDYQDAPATENYLNTNGFCTGFHYIVNDSGTELILEIVNITAPFVVYLGF